MADDGSDEDLARLVADLVRTLRELEQEVEPPSPGDGPRLPTPRELRRFASEVAIPGIILVLETNVRALRLLQRALRLSETADEARESSGEIRERARSVSETSLERLDDALVELSDALEGRPANDDATRLLDEARDLRAEVQQRLRESTQSNGDGPSAGGRDDRSTASEGGSEGDDRDTGDDETTVAVDVDAELQSIKNQLDESEDGGPDSDADTNGSSDSDDTGASDDGDDVSADTGDDGEDVSADTGDDGDDGEDTG
jgi:hypothetical protein